MNMENAKNITNEIIQAKQLVLETRHGDFRCFAMPGNTEDTASLQVIKSFVKRKYEKAGYKGFSMDIDALFDPHAMYFFVINHTEKLVTTSRVIIRQKGARLPIECANKQDGTKYCLEEKFSSGKRFAEITSFGASWRYTKGHRPLWLEGLLVSIPTFNTFPALKLMFSCLGAFVQSQAVDTVFCLVDQTNQQSIKTYTNEGFRPSNKLTSLVSFPTYGKSSEQGLKPTEWCVYEIKGKKIEKHALAMQRFQIPLIQFPAFNLLN